MDKSIHENTVLRVGTFDITLKVTNKYFFAIKQYQLIVI